MISNWKGLVNGHGLPNTATAGTVRHGVSNTQRKPRHPQLPSAKVRERHGRISPHR